MALKITQASDEYLEELVPTAHRFIQCDEVRALKISVFDNKPLIDNLDSPRRFTMELYYYFTKPQAIWDDQKEAVLRNYGSHLKNIRRMPSETDYAQDWYNTAQQRARNFSSDKDFSLHCKMGVRDKVIGTKQIRYQTVLCQYASLAVVDKQYHMQIQIATPSIDDDGKFNAIDDTVYSTVLDESSEFELNGQIHQLHYTTLRFD